MAAAYLAGRETAQDALKEKAQEEGQVVGTYVIVRCQESGVFAGVLRERQGREVVLADARRLWYWDGAASVSELAERGPSRPHNCKFPCPVSQIWLADAKEILAVTPRAEAAIRSVPEWTEHK